MENSKEIRSIEIRPDGNDKNELSGEITSFRQQPENASDVGADGRNLPLKKIGSGMSAQKGDQEDKLLECSTDNDSKKKKKRSRKKKKSVSTQDESADNTTSAAVKETALTDPNLSSTGKLMSGEKGENNEETLDRKPSSKKKKKKKKTKESRSHTSPEPPGNGEDDDLKGCQECHTGHQNSNEVEMSTGITSNGCSEPDIVKMSNKESCYVFTSDADEKKPPEKDDGNAEVTDAEIDIQEESDDKPKLSLADGAEVTGKGKEDLFLPEEDYRNCSSEVLPKEANARVATSGETLDTSSVSICAEPIGEDQESDVEVEEDYSSPAGDPEGRNILCIFKLIYGVGLQAIRKLFMEINPTWTNKPSDAAAFDRGKMNLGKEEEIVYNSGDINKWDFSLITTALSYSNTCALEMNKRPGCHDALKKLKKIRNKLLGHPYTDKMCDNDFNLFWAQLSTHFVTLGADPADIAEIKIQSDSDLLAGEYYKTLFLEEKDKYSHLGQSLDSLHRKFDAVFQLDALDSSCKTPVSPKDLSGPNWDEWLKFCDAVEDFDTRKNQYILVTDARSQENLDCFSVLRGVSWKMVLDFDPMSEEKGFYHEFTSHEGQGNLVSMATPAELKPKSIISLAREIDSNKVQWLFVNGRSSDTGGKQQEFAEWEATSVKEISRFFVCCCDPDKFDKQKPVVCLILPFSPNTVPYLERTMGRLIENFGDQFRFKVVSFKQVKRLSVLEKVKVRIIDLAPDLLYLGLKELLCLSSSQQYRMPTSQAQVYTELSEKEYLFLTEHLEVLYVGCEELPVPSNSPEEDENLQKLLEEHRRLFFSGNAISFASLYDNHDAKREIEENIKIHVQRLLDKTLTRSVIVEIKHSPGTGGTTIARRVMWDLHKAYPCAFIEVNAHHYYDEDNTYAGKLAVRIAALEEICRTSPVILIDGKQSRAIEVLSNKLVRMLGNKGKRALLLRCLHGSKTSPKESQEISRIHQVFYVDVKLEDSYADLNQFQKKYNELIEKSLGEARTSGPCRVFHFPLLAMMNEFWPRLKKIIDDSWDEMESLQQDIAVVVAFLQKYGNQPTPALLLYDAFNRYIHVKDRNNVTYEEIKQLFNEHLLNLMIPLNPLLRRGRKYRVQEASPERYTLQHRVVAELLLKKAFQTQGCDLFSVANQFLRFPVYHREAFMPLFEDLFVYNKDGQKKRKFSLLFEDLKTIDQERAAEVFCEAAEKTGDSVVFSNAARFFAKMVPPLFPKAMELIEKSFKATNAKQRFRSISHTKGVVLYIELQHLANTGRIENLQKLEDQATKVLDAYREARNFPPTYPNPLIGEVEVWLVCIGWIMKNKCQRDAEKTLKFLTNQCPEFFRSCVSHSFYLLDTVDGIVQSVPNLPDPDDTQRRCNNARVALMKNFGTRLSSTGRGRDAEDVVQACKALCSTKNFPRSSALELKRLQALFFLHSSDAIDTLKQEHLVFLQKLLEDLVFKENEHQLAYHLMKVCILATGPQNYTLEQGFALTEKWSEVSRHDSLPYFYQMAICFLQILDGNAIEFMPKYLKALKSCREKSQNHCRSTQSTLFVSKGGQGMSRLVTRNTLFREETDYPTEVQSEMVTKFWLVDSRRKLLECKGRVRIGPLSDRGKSYPYIELVPGKVELYLPKNAGIGRVDRDYTPGQLVYFVISFTLQGPVANGITFEPQNKAPH